MVVIAVKCAKAILRIDGGEVERLLSGPIVGEDCNLPVVLALMYGYRLWRGKEEPQRYEVFRLGGSGTIEGTEAQVELKHDNIRFIQLNREALRCNEEWAGPPKICAVTDGTMLTLLLDTIDKDAGCLQIHLSDLLQAMNN